MQEETKTPISPTLSTNANASAPRATASTGLPRSRLTSEATHLITEFMRQHGLRTRYPESDVMSLLARIQATNGNEDYTREKLDRYLANPRSTARRTVMNELKSNGMHSLTPHQLKGLEDLYAGQNNPGDRVKASWSSVLGVPLPLIDEFLQTRARETSTDASYLPPTPADSTTSPEISAARTPPLSFLEPARTETLPQTMDQPISRGFTPFEYPPISDQDVLSNLLAPLACLQAHDLPGCPENPEQYDAAFAPYAKSMNDLIQSVSAGLLENWGFHPSMLNRS